MFHAKNFLARSFAEIFGRKRENDAASTISSPLVDALYVRELVGLGTRLRELHEIAGLSQTEALKDISKLEKAGVVVIEPDFLDAFNSHVHLSSETRLRLDRVDKEG